MHAYKLVCGLYMSFHLQVFNIEARAGTGLVVDALRSSKHRPDQCKLGKNQDRDAVLQRNISRPLRPTQRIYVWKMQLFNSYLLIESTQHHSKRANPTALLAAKTSQDLLAQTPCFGSLDSSDKR